MGRALGVIQSEGLIALIAAIDTALKTSNVTVNHIELVQGGSMVLVRIYGGISEVNAAIEAGTAAAKMISKGCVSSVVIGNPII